MNKSLDRIRDKPRMVLTAAEFKALPEYSCSIPTGVVFGKMWKRHDGATLRGTKSGNQTRVAYREI